MHIKQFLENKINKINVNHFDYDHMVYIRLFEGCNLACEHCYIPPNPKKIDSSFYENKGITNVLVEEASVTKGSKLYIQWHGGEPTMLGPDYLENAIKNVEADDRFIYQHGIQTNLINFSENKEKWINIYKNYFNSKENITLYVTINKAGTDWWSSSSGGQDIYGNVSVGIKKIEKLREELKGSLKKLTDFLKREK